MDQPPDDLLDLDPDEFVARGNDVMTWIARYFESARSRPVLSRAEPGDLAAALPARGPEKSRPWDDILNDLDDLIMPSMTHWNHPGFLAYFANTGSAPGVLGAALATALNPNGMLWRTSPASTELEQRVTSWMADWLGLPADQFGIINDTASTSSLVALAAARQTIPAYNRQQGMRSVGPLRVYLSDQAHSSIDKAAVILGLGLDAVCRVPTTSDYSLDVDALRRAIAEDRERGVTPMCVVATAGTTSTTSLDPVEEILAVCEQESLWLHVDAAYGGAAAIVPELRGFFRGWERADSVVVNPHKWLFAPMCCSLLYCRRPEALADAFSLVPEYLRSDVGATVDEADRHQPDLMNYGIQLGRPFRSLTLWMVMSSYGRRAMAQLVANHIEYAAELAALIDAHPDFERLAPTPLSAVCFRCRPGAGSTGDGTELEPVDEDPWEDLNDALLAAINAEGTSFLSHTRLRGRLTLRVAIGNLRTARSDVLQTWESLQLHARRLTDA